MTPTRRDTLKAAGAASGLAMLGSHAIAQQDSPGSSDDNPGAQQLEEGQAGVRAGHFVAGAPAVDVRLVPAEGTAGGGVGGDTNGTNTTNDTNTSDTNTSEDLPVGNDSNATNGTNDTDDSVDIGNDTNDTNDTEAGMETPDDTTGGQGELIAQDVSFGDVSEYTNVEAGDYTVQLVEPSAEPTDTDGVTGNDTTDTNGTNGTIETNDTLDDGNETNDTLDDGNETNDTVDVGNETNDTNDTDGGMVAPDDTTGGEVIYEADVTVGETYHTVAAVGTSVDDIEAHLLKDYDAAQVRLVHASPDAPAVDVVAPDATMTLFDDVSFGEATEYVGVPPGSYSLSVREAAEMNDGDEVLTADVEVESGDAYSVYAVGSPEGGEDGLQLVVEQDGQGADAGLGQEGAPGQQPGGPGGNETDNETGNGTGGPPGQDDGDGRGQSGGRGQGQGPGGDNESDI